MEADESVSDSEVDSTENHAIWIEGEAEPFVDASKIFNGHRALGLISNHIPLVTRYVQRRKETLIVTIIGNSFHTYGSKKLGLLNVGTAHDKDITCVAGDTYHVYTASGTVIRAWRRSTELKHEYKGHEKSVHLMLPFGPHLISVDEANVCKVWDIKEEVVMFELPLSTSNFMVSALVHPITYLNKVLFGSTQGSMQLWNLRTARQVYAFDGWGSPITLLEQAPAVDVVAVGLASGDIVLHNLKFDETVVKFRQEWGPVTSLAFRTDGPPIMVTGSTQGHLAIWDLEQRILLQQHRHAHNGAVTGMKSMLSEPLLVTSSPDNTLKMWIFDQSDGGVRLLHQKSGHKSPPIKIRFHDHLGEWILSAGLDSSLRSFSTVTDILNRNLGTAHGERKKWKLPPIADFSSEPIRDKEWNSIAAVHRDRVAVTTWSFHRSTMGEHHLLHERFRNRENPIQAVATSACVSACGHFCIIGYSSGHVDRFNMQSGLHRATYVHCEASNSPLASLNGIRGVASDALNQLVVGAVADGKLVFWNFKSGEKNQEIHLDYSTSFMVVHRQSGLLAVALDDFNIAVVEMQTAQLIRVLKGHEGRLTDLAFSPDGRWLVSAAQDTSIRTWDLPSSTCVDWFRVPKSCVSLAFSGNGAYLATAHVDDLGVYLWNNKSIYSQISLRALSDKFASKLAPLPGAAVQVDSSGEQNDVMDDEEEFVGTTQIRTAEESLITLSMMADSRWKNLLSLDVIKRRNKPKEPPKAPKQAPFFLQNMLNGAAKGPEPESRLMEVSGMFSLPLSPWAEQLLDAKQDEEYLQVVGALKAMGPSAIDTEIRSLSPHTIGGSVALLSQFLSAIAIALRTRKDYELVQAYLGLFLKVHCSSLAENRELADLIHKVSDDLKDSWSTLQTGFESVLCLVSFFINPVL